jgi:cell division transport system permease protein
LVSKSEALLRFREQNKDNPSVRDSITEAENPLPPSFDVEVKDKSKLTFIEEFIKQPDVKPLLDDKDPTSYQGKKKDTVNSILKVSNFLQIAGLISSILSTIISILIIFNTIRMAIFTRKQEIEIMKLVGATNWFIRGPFIFEAAMYGIIGAVVATSLGYVLLLSGGPKLSSYGIQTGPILDYFRHYPIFIIGGELLIGILIGGISSLLAMSRYLKLE